MISNIILVIIAHVLLGINGLVTDLKDAEKYLEQYDYIETDSFTDFKTALINFQEKYNIFVDGELNEETLNLMNRPRCEEGENSFRVRPKWNKTGLT